MVRPRSFGVDVGRGLVEQPRWAPPAQDVCPDESRHGTSSLKHTIIRFSDRFPDSSKGQTDDRCKTRGAAGACGSSSLTRAAVSESLPGYIRMSGWASLPSLDATIWRSRAPCLIRLPASRLSRIEWFKNFDGGRGGLQSKPRDCPWARLGSQSSPIEPCLRRLPKSSPNRDATEAASSFARMRHSFDGGSLAEEDAIPSAAY